MNRIPVIIENRFAPASSWTEKNPILLSGDIGIESDTGLYKIGNNTSCWNDLNYENSDLNSIKKVELYKAGNWTTNLDISVRDNASTKIPLYMKFLFDMPTKRIQFRNKAGSTIVSTNVVEANGIEVEDSYKKEHIVYFLQGIEVGQTYEIYTQINAYDQDIAWKKIGSFYLGRSYDIIFGAETNDYILIDPKLSDSVDFECNFVSELTQIKIPIQIKNRNIKIYANGIIGGFEQKSTDANHVSYQSYQSNLGKIKITVVWDKIN